jgi:exosortase
MDKHEPPPGDVPANRADSFRAAPPQRLYAALILSGTALTALAKGILEGSAFEAYVLWVLAALISFFTIRHSLPDRTRFDQPVAWVLLAAALLLAILFPSHPPCWPIWLGICSALAWGSGAALAGKLSPAVFLFTVLVPSIDYLYTLLSFPLSRISAALTVAVLHVFGVTCSYDNAIILIGEKQIAVTAACSGIELLAVLLLIGWAVVYFTHRRGLIRVAHYLTLLPIIIGTNALRLVIVISLYLAVGDRAFNLTLHHLLGYGVVAVSTLLLFSIGTLFSSMETP